AAYMLGNSGSTKLSAGIGVTYQSTNLALIAQPFQGSRQDTFYDVQGNATTFVSTFAADRGQLLAPRFINWSLALEQKLPAQVFMKAEFIHRDGIHDFVYNTMLGLGGTDFVLQNTRTDHYFAFRIDARRTFK